MFNSKLKFSLSSFLLGVMFTATILGFAREMSFWKNSGITRAAVMPKIIKEANAQEIYPEFVCPCCGKPLDPENVCCGVMQQRIDFIDSLVKNGLSEDEIMKSSVKEWGIEALVSKQKQEEFKKRLIAEAPKDSPRVAVEKDSFDFGQIRQTDGIVTTEFKFSNKGKNDLIIDKLLTSCGCTSASIVYKGKEGPKFTMEMNGVKNPKNWSVVIPAGEEASLKVYYDPNKHGPQKEPKLSITRTISIFSNDPVDFEKKLRIDLEQVPK